LNDLCVLFFGDSFVAGAGDAERLGWPDRVVAASWANGLPLTAYNLGVRGEHTGDVAQRFAAEARPRLIPEADNRVVIAVGANDVSLDERGVQELSTEESLAEMERLLDSADELGARAMVVGPGPSGVTDHDERSAALSARFEDLCERRGVRYLDVLGKLDSNEAWRRERVENDGIHPGSDGYAVYADLILASGWLEWLRER
jgi:lysophospholipase L1-like esterase